MRILKLNLPDFPHIETWDQFEKYIEFRNGDLEDLEDLLSYDKIELYQNTLDGGNYHLKDIDINYAINYWIEYFLDLPAYRADREALKQWKNLHKIGLDIQHSHLHDWTSGCPITIGWKYRINPEKPKRI
jgi:hypothetical protein